MEVYLKLTFFYFDSKYFCKLKFYVQKNFAENNERLRVKYKAVFYDGQYP